MDVGVRCIISLWKVASFRNREVIRYLFQKNEPRLSVVGAFFYKFYEFDVLTKC